MARASVKIAVFLLFFNASAGLITASGLGAALDVNPEIGGDEQAEALNESVSTVEPSQGITDTLFSLYTSVAGGFLPALTFIFYGTVMLANAGVPSWLLTFVFGPAYLVVAADVVYYFIGR